MTDHIAFNDMEVGWPLMLHLAVSQGDRVSPRGRETRELTGFSFTLRKPQNAILHSSARTLNHAYSAAEFLWVMAGRDEVGTISFFNEQLRQFADQDDGARFFGAYGPPIVEQLPQAIDALIADADTRQAVVSIWRPNPRRTRDVPCTLSLQFLLRRGRLSLITTMRSNDLWLGTPYDVPLFCRVLSYAASRLGVPVGEYHHHAGSLHVYERDLEQVFAAMEPRHVPVRPASLEVGPFEPATDPRRVWDVVEEIVSGRPGGFDPGAGYCELLTHVAGFVARKRERLKRGEAPALKPL